MTLNTLKPEKGSISTSKRVGRGIGSGKGKTAGRGVKGQKARSGVAIKGFEGGQMPLDRRLPKMGFTNWPFSKIYAEISLGRIQEALDSGRLNAKELIDEEALAKAKLLKPAKNGVKILANGVLHSAVQIQVAKATRSAVAQIEKAGGSFKSSAGA